MTNLEELASKIIREQQTVIGPLAWSEARKVRGLKVDPQSHSVEVEGDPKQALEGLVAQYERLFGRASREVCRDAVRPLISRVPKEEVPAVLR